MTRRVYLHVGAPKTGTTYLQDRLGRNARRLAAHDVHVPRLNPITTPASQVLVATTASRSTPCSMPSPVSIQTRSSVARLPVALFA